MSLVGGSRRLSTRLGVISASSGEQCHHGRRLNSPSAWWKSKLESIRAVCHRPTPPGLSSGHRIPSSVKGPEHWGTLCRSHVVCWWFMDLQNIGGPVWVTCDCVDDLWTSRTPGGGPVWVTCSCVALYYSRFKSVPLWLCKGEVRSYFYVYPIHYVLTYKNDPVNPGWFNSSIEG